MNNLKLILTVLSILLITLTYSQIDSCNMDTSYYSNNKIKTIYGWNDVEFNQCGYYAEFDSLGNKIVEGQFISVDSIPCKDCFDNYYNPPKKYEYSNTRELKTGIWTFFHTNGNIKETGKYSKYVHEYQGTVNDYIPKNQPYNVYSHKDYLKDGNWEYYDENGNNYMTIEYLDGQLIFKTERH